MTPTHPEAEAVKPLSSVDDVLDAAHAALGRNVVVMKDASEMISKLYAEIESLRARLEKAEAAMCDARQFMDGVKPDAVAEGWWTDWDQSVRDRLSFAALDAADRGTEG